MLPSTPPTLGWQKMTSIYWSIFVFAVAVFAFIVYCILTVARFLDENRISEPLPYNVRTQKPDLIYDVV